MLINTATKRAKIAFIFNLSEPPTLQYINKNTDIPQKPYALERVERRLILMRMMKAMISLHE